MQHFPYRFAYRELNSHLGRERLLAERMAQYGESLEPDFPEKALSEGINGEDGMLFWFQPHITPEF